MDRYTSGDREGAYLLLADEIRNNIPQATWVEIVNTCNTQATLHLDAKGVRMEGDDKAIVRVSLGTAASVSKTLVYEDGVWHHGGDSDVRTWFGKTAAQVIAERKAKSDCS